MGLIFSINVLVGWERRRRNHVLTSRNNAVRFFSCGVRSGIHHPLAA
jgi:hypothetical protein